MKTARCADPAILGDAETERLDDMLPRMLLGFGLRVQGSQKKRQIRI
jgi:hypothetical protein